MRPSAIEASLTARRLTRWGARVVIAPNEIVAQALLPEREWSAILIDHAHRRGGDRHAARRDARRLKPARHHDAAGAQRARGSEVARLYRLSDQAGARRLARRAFADRERRLLAIAGNLARRERGAERRGGLSILVAEDNEINALLARALLQKLGHRPTVVASGQAAMESFQAAHSAGLPYDLILMDVRMEGIDGLEATRRIRAIEQASGAPRTRIIALTANAFPEHRDACLKAGMDGFLSKPLDREKLDALLSASEHESRRMTAA